MEHETLLQRGFVFTITYKKRIRFWKYGIVRIVKKKVTIHQPPLSTLSALATEFLKFDFENEISNHKEGSKLAVDTCRQVSSVIAIASIGIHDPKVVDKEKEQIQIEELTDIIYYNMTPDLLFKIGTMVRFIMNIGNFTTSISLIKDLKKSLPTLIEKED